MRTNRQKKAGAIRRNQELIRQMKKHPCMDCGGTFDPDCMDFDHRDPNKKSFEISNKGSTKTFRKLVAELAKCDLICANCHRLRTKRQREDMVFQTEEKPPLFTLAEDLA